MDTEQLMLDVGQANEIKLAFRKAGWTNADIKKLCEGETPSLVLAVIKGELEIKHVIDLDADPFVPEDWTVEEHIKAGSLEWDPAKINLYLSKKQQGGKVLKGNELREELEGKGILNANVLDYLLAHPYLIPGEWKGRYVFFWGTIYRRSVGGLCVRYLYWSGGHWYWYYFWLGSDFDDDRPAALLASGN